MKYRLKYVRTRGSTGGALRDILRRSTERCQLIDEYNCQLAYEGWVECRQIPINGVLIFVIHLPRSLENRHQDKEAEAKVRRTFFSKGLGRGILGDPRRFLTQLRHLLKGGLVPILFIVWVSGSQGKANGHSRGCYDDALDSGSFGTGAVRFG